jgi:DNA-binding transcriptional MerR regulator
MPSLTELRSLLHSFPAQLPITVRKKALQALLQRSGIPLADTQKALRAEALETGQHLQQQLAVKQAVCEREVHALEQAIQTQQDERTAQIEAYTPQRAQLCQQLIALDALLACLGAEAHQEDADDNDLDQETTTLTPSRRARVLGLK